MEKCVELFEREREACTDFYEKLKVYISIIKHGLIFFRFDDLISRKTIDPLSNKVMFNYKSTGLELISINTYELIVQPDIV